MPQTPRPHQPTKPASSGKTRLFVAKAFDRVRRRTGLFRTPTPKPGESRVIRETILGAIGSWERVPKEQRKAFARAEAGEVGALENEPLSAHEISLRKAKQEQIERETKEAKKAEHRGQPRDAIFHFAKAGNWKEVKRVLRHQTEKTGETFTGSQVIHLGVFLNDAACGAIQNPFLERTHSNALAEKLVEKAKAIANKAMFVSVVNMGADRMARVRIMQGAGIVHAEIYKTTRALINANMPETEENKRTLYKYRELHGNSLSATMQAESELKRATYLGREQRPWEVIQRIIRSVE